MIADEIRNLQPGESLNLDLGRILQEFAGGDPDKTEGAMTTLQNLADANGCILNHQEMRDIYVVKGPTAEADRA
ncbi:MAG: hypothetical protein ABW026_08015 [Microvirga sp.]